MRSRLPVAVLTVALANLPACGITDVERDTEPPVQTSELAYTLRETLDGRALEVEIPYRYENRTDAPICISHCNGAFSWHLEKRIREHLWKSVWSPIVPECLSRPPITIGVGETFRDTLRIVHGLREKVHPKMDVDELEGIYRIDLTNAARFSSSSPEFCGGRQLLKEQRISNRFVLRRD